MSQMNQKEAAKPMHLEDLAALKEVSEDTVLDELQNRHLDGQSYTFVGDVLLYMNPNQDEPIYENKVISLRVLKTFMAIIIPFNTLFLYIYMCV